MSTQKGNVQRTRANKYKNTFKYVHNKNSRKTKAILEAPIEGVCEKCYKVLEWKKEYRKYKPLTVPKRCTMCQEKRVTRSYTNVCEPCAKKNGICAKCREKKTIVQDFDSAKKEKLEQLEKERILAQLTERERRRYLMHLEKGEIDSDEDSDEEDSESDGEKKEEKPKQKVVVTATLHSIGSSAASSNPTASVERVEKSAVTGEDQKEFDEEDSSEDAVDSDEEDDDNDDDAEDNNDNDDDDIYDDEDEDRPDLKQVLDTSKPIPGRRIVTGRRTLLVNDSKPPANKPLESKGPKEEVDDDSDDASDLNKSFEKDDEEDEGNDPFSLALKAAEEKKKLLESLPVVDLSAKYNPKPSSEFELYHEVDELDDEMQRKLIIDEKGDDSDDEGDDGPVKSFQFDAFKK